MTPTEPESWREAYLAEAEKILRLQRENERLREDVAGAEVQRDVNREIRRMFCEAVGDDEMPEAIDKVRALKAENERLRGACSLLARWLGNQPDDADLELALQQLSRPDVQEELRELGVLR